MSEKRLNTRIINKHDIEAHWLLATNFYPEKGELIVYDIEVDENGEVLKDSNGNSLLPEGRTIPYNHERFKIGDGIHNVNDLPFHVGLSTKDGGEVFNDYENNKALSKYSSASGYNTSAGGKAFTIKKIIKKSTRSTVYLEVPADVLNSYIIEHLRFRIQFTHEINEGTSFSIVARQFGRDAVVSDYYDFGKSTCSRYSYSQITAEEAGISDSFIESNDIVGTTFTALTNNSANSAGGMMSDVGIAQGLIDGNYSALFEIINHSQQDLEIVLALMDTVSNSGDLYNYRSSTTIVAPPDEKSFEIEDTIGIEIDDIFSLYSTQLETNLDYYGKVTGIDSTEITVDKIPDGLDPLQADKITYIWFPYKPYLNGDVDIGAGTHSDGYDTIAVSFGARSEGYNTNAGGKYGHAEGNSTKAGYAAHAQNLETEAIGIASHAQGTRSKATGRQSDANGFETIASGDNATSNGYKTIASGGSADAGGSGTVASGAASFTRGLKTKATADRGFAIGNETEANAKDTFASGWLTKATAWTQSVVGKANVEDPYALFIVGNGSSDADRKNAFVVKADGSARIAKSGTANDSVVNYQQLREYVAENGGKSSWEEQSELLFNTGVVRIKNVVDTNGEDEGAVICIGNATSSNEGQSVTISKYDICFDGLAESNKTSTLNRFGLNIIKDGKDVNITGDGINYNDQIFSWDRLFAAIEKIEKL